MTRALKRITIKNLASIIGKQLNKYDIDAVLTGGACVTVFSRNMYVSSDLDFVSSATEDMPRVVKKAMEEIGFSRSAEGYFRNPDYPYFIEFISSPLAVGKEPPKKVIKMKTKMGSFRLLSPTDCVKDRLAAYFHWDDLQSLKQAVMVAANQRVDLKELRRWSKAEGHPDKHNDFLKQLKKK